MTPFNNYLHRLMADPDALRAFLGDPIGQSDAHGLSKAERSVLRRVLAGASTASTNGYAIVRPLEAYQQGVRMLQNVMHRSMGAALAAGNAAANTLVVYYGSDSRNPGTDPYANAEHFQGSGDTIADLMASIAANNPALQYADASGFSHPIIESFTINGAVYSAPPHDAATSEDPFWFYSINGGPSPNTAGGISESYAEAKISPGDVVYWQVIAPGPDYGFQSCKPSDGTHTKALA